MSVDTISTAIACVEPFRTVRPAAALSSGFAFFGSKYQCGHQRDCGKGTNNSQENCKNIHPLNLRVWSAKIKQGVAQC
ncbi:hypothetical protein [Ruegeria sp. HKCCD7255]|uniref:hypothetical protein n=1 Tax=Ruegeria sp. HKCCD7255 TaxID=2683004 RepID=UPI0014881087|nr:hypothetical protein [Ruegeria sp. HKCCD7255]